MIYNMHRMVFINCDGPSTNRSQDKIDLFRMDPRNPFFQVWENVKTMSRKSDFAIRTGIVLRFLQDTVGF